MSIWFAVSAFYAGLTLLYAWPLLPALGSSLPGDLGDPGLNTWILWWNAQAVPLTERWWHAPIFFPMRGALALSETLLGLAPLTTPLQWLGAGPVTAYNAAFLLSFFAAALAAHALAQHLTGRHAAGLVAGVAFGFNPYRAAQISHLQILMSCWMPLALLALHRFLESRRRRDLALFGAAWLMNGLTTGYFLFYFAVLAGLWILWFGRGLRDRLAIAGTAALASLPLVPLLFGYWHHQRSLGVSRGLNEIASYSADLSAIWAASPFVWLSSHWTLAPMEEGELYPGVVTLALAVLGVTMEWRAFAAAPARAQETAGRRRLRRGLLGAAGLVAVGALASALAGGWSASVAGVPISMNRPHKALTTALWLFVFSMLLDPRLAALWRRRTTGLFYFVAACLMFIFALGPLPHAFGAPLLYRVTPYSALMELPGGDSLRVPARFAMLMMLCLSQAAALAFARWSDARGLARSGRSRAPAAALVLLIALDGWVPVLKTDSTPPAVDLTGIDTSAPVLELPIRDLFSDTRAMLRATSHGHALINGYSGYEPEPYVRLRDALRRHEAAAFDDLRPLGPLLVIVNAEWDPDGREREFVSGLAGARLVRNVEAAAVYVIE